MPGNIDIWGKSLLDLGKRNNLINFKESKSSTARVIQPSIQELYNQLTASKTLTVMIQREDRTVSKGSILLGDKENIEKTLRNLRNKAKTAVEETGNNILYLSLGQIHWFEKEEPDQICIAPIVLVPIEIVQESITSPFKVKLYDSEVIINPSISFKLEQEYKIKLEYELTEDSELSSFYQYIQDKIIQLNWSVTHDSFIGMFSFLKLNMYADLMNNQELIEKNEIVKGLMGVGNSIERIPSEYSESKNIDSLFTVFETFQVLNADSSQQQAILAAKKGYSFILQGPPGTGKSQTITNIIAECLADDKKVLFVAEKMAALEVVYRNLNQQGIGDYCLQLHSHKANKADVIKDLVKFMDLQRYEETKSISENLNKLVENRDFLNSYVKEMHMDREPLGKSIYRISGLLSKLNNVQNTSFEIPSIDKMNIQDFNRISELIYEMVSTLVKLGSIQDSPFLGLDHNISFDYKNAFIQHAKSFIVKIEEIQTRLAEIYSIVGLDGLNSLTNTRKFFMIHEMLKNIPYLERSWLEKGKFTETYQILEEVSKSLMEVKSKEQSLLGLFSDQVYQLNLDEILAKLETQFRSIFRVFNSEYKQLKSLISPTLIKGKMSYKKLCEYLPRLIFIKDTRDKYKTTNLKLKQTIGEQYQSEATDWKFLLKSYSWLCELEKYTEHKRITKQFVNFILDDGRQNIDDQISLLEEQIVNLNNDLAFFSNAFDSSVFEIEPYPYTNLVQKMDRIIERVDDMDVWMEYVNNNKKLIELHQVSFSKLVLSGEFDYSELVNIYKKRFYQLWLDFQYSQFPIIKDSSGDKLNITRSMFVNFDKLQLEIAKSRIKSALSKRLPSPQEAVVAGTELSILLRESKKVRKVMPLKLLFEKIPHQLLNLKPCLLMSPLSVSSYLDPKQYMFDVVIFDEASQVSTENAIGAIYRGKQLIIVGDREQLPPTNFFVSGFSDDNEDDDNEFGAFESILDEASSFMNRMSLQWHYRSKHESLIAYSNYQIYKNLITFPNAMDGQEDYGVEFIHVENAIYDRGESRSNKIEAKRVADLVFKHFTKHKDRSLGVVAFSEAQRAAIEFEIISLRKADTSFESFFNEDKDEPFFVKNLENVQGDERDTIIFSIGYGKDATGNLLMNFGPLSKEGGYRRLNVAITRAKFNLKLVSSILPTDIDLNRTQSKGIIMLRGYMDFALRGYDALTEMTTYGTMIFDSPFEEDVHDFLVEHGFQVDTQVGSLGYRIDMAVKHPTLKGVYVLGIECDGATYHSAKSARDRDRLREEVLKQRGWNIYRVWSTDWLRKRKMAEEALLSSVKHAIELFGNGSDSSKNEPEKSEQNFVVEVEVPKDIDYGFDTYIKATVKHSYNSLERGPSTLILSKFNEILETESPIQFEEFVRRVLPLFDRKATNETFNHKIMFALHKLPNFSYVNGFIRKKNVKMKNLRVIPDEIRKIETIDPEELEIGLLRIVEKLKGIEYVSLMKALAIELGYTNLSEKSYKLLEVPLKRLVSTKKLKNEDGIVSLK